MNSINHITIFSPFITASTARSYLYGVQVGQRRVLPGTTQIKSFVFVIFFCGTDESVVRRKKILYSKNLLSKSERLRKTKIKTHSQRKFITLKFTTKNIQPLRQVVHESAQKNSINKRNVRRSFSDKSLNAESFLRFSYD